MKPHHTFLIAIGIATPLWLRQYRVEREFLRWAIRQDKEVHAYAEGLTKAMGRYARETNKSLERQLRRESR